jgi:hypothetical protein
MLRPIAAKESEGPDEMTGRLRAVLDPLSQRNEVEYLAELVTVLAPARFIALDDIARVTCSNTAELLDAVEVQALEGLDDGLQTGDLDRIGAGIGPPVKVATCPGCCEDAKG